MQITLKDGVVKEYDSAMSVLDIARSISEGLARNACAGLLDGEVVDVRTLVDHDCELQILTFHDEEVRLSLRHTAAHILSQAVKRLFPHTKLSLGPAIQDGFYY